MSADPDLIGGMPVLGKDAQPVFVKGGGGNANVINFNGVSTRNNSVGNMNTTAGLPDGYQNFAGGESVTTAASMNQPQSSDPFAPNYQYQPPVTDHGPDPDRLTAEIERGQRQDWEQRYKPIGRELVDTINDPEWFQGLVDDAGAGARDGYQDAEQAMRMELGRYGLSPDQGDLGKLRRQAGLAEVGAKNRTRQGVDSLRAQLRDEAIQIGRGIENISGASAQQLSSLAKQREAANDQAQAQEQANTVSAIATVATLAVLAFCDENLKQDIAPVEEHEVLRDLMATRIYEFNYIPEVGISGRHTGPMRQQVPDRFKGPENTVNVANETHALIVGVQHLMKRVSFLENELKRLQGNG